MSMDELEISGKRYISSKRAARENRYHVDYIGQLIRSGKIIGSKVGRAWYVEVDSLNDYLGQENAAASYAPNQKQPPMQTYEQKNTHATAPVAIGGLRYISDDEPLLPPVQKQQSVQIHEVLEEVSKVRPRVQEDHQDYQEYEEPPRAEVRHTQPTPKGLLYLTAAVGIVALVGAFSMSYFLKYDTTVEAASVTSSIHF